MAELAAAPAPDGATARLRVFHGPEDIGGIPQTIARAQRRLGHDAHAGVFARDPATPARSDRAMSRRLVPRTLRAMQLAASYDIFQLYFGQGLLGSRLRDVPLLKKLGKRVYFYFCGCDARDEKATIMRYPISGCRDCFPKLCAPNRELAQRVAGEYADRSFVSTPDLLEFVERSVLVPSPYDADVVDAVGAEPAPERDPDRFVVVHAPSNELIKGTRYLTDAVQRLRGDGVPIDLVLLRGKSHRDVLRAARGADLAVDQLLVGSYGLFATEMMALGVPVAVFIRDDLVEEYPEPPPVQNVSPETIERVLRAAVEGSLPLVSRALEAQEYAREIHHPNSVARLCLELYG